MRAWLADFVERMVWPPIDRRPYDPSRVNPGRQIAVVLFATFLASLLVLWLLS